MGLQAAGGDNANPGVYVESIASNSGGVVPITGRTAALLGEGLRQEILVSSAIGKGNDGLDVTCSTTTGQDGRHFKLSFAPAIKNRTQLFKNGIPLTGLESTAEGSFSSLFDYKINIEEGCIELQGSSLVDQGGAYYKAGSSNIGNGTIDSLSLLDISAPSETWTIKCSSVQKDGYGDPIDGYAKFSAIGSVSGNLLDGYGNKVFWQSNGTVKSNQILEFSISEGSIPFNVGDKFTIKVISGVLSRGDSLIAHYISEGDINDPEFFTDARDLYKKHGNPSLTNRLSLGAQLAFANTPPGVWTVQTAPSIPRRVSYTLVSSASGNINTESLSFNLPLNVVPDTDSNINFFLTDPVTKIEEQIIPNKVAFYDPDFTSDPLLFQFGSDSFSYTVVQEDSVQKSGSDGVLIVIDATTATLESNSVTFNLDDLNGFRTVKIYDAANALNNGIWDVVSVANGIVTIYSASGFVDETDVIFEVLDSTATTCQILFTQDLALTLGQSLRATIVDEKDADFYDVGWQTAYEALEKIETDMIVPLPSQTISACIAGARSHVEAMSQLKMKKERVLLTGAIQGLTPDNIIGNEDAAVEDIGILEGIQGDDLSEILAGDIEDLTDYSVPTNYGNGTAPWRIEYMYPDQIVVQIGADRVFADGFFMAAALAGFYSKTANVAIPATNKFLAGFTILNNRTYRPIIEENLSKAGVSLVKPALGGGKVVWGKTTTQSGNALEEEMSVTFIRDRVAKVLRASFENEIGNPDERTTQGSLMAKVIKIISGFIPGILTAYRNVTVKRNATEPRQWDIFVEVQPRLPINWIYIPITFSVFQ